MHPNSTMNEYDDSNNAILQKPPMNPVIDDPKFTSESWRTLSRYEKLFQSRIMNLLEDKMFKENRDRIVDADVRECVKIALEELLHGLKTTDGK